ncbi:hypothetical protein BDZ94DRAFT_1330905 [Collybia nuda]|uniref:Nephrocystin 3-like N-terminal domain-containing protein n=1 Tax=Collybia nuda TaxID=64659 RepID=A0A9P6CFA4_9AGAR|nr:hypothetical protein BDZ94DRAFT_1330905 [Collybia nuda]
MLEKCVAAGAFHDSSERLNLPKCHPRTRMAVLNKIRQWHISDSLPCIMWLYGPAGAGKSAIAQTMAEECRQLHTLAVSFFFSRTISGCNNVTRLVATIAYQIAQGIPETQSYIERAIENDPMIFSRSLATQLYHLLTKPLLNVAPSSSGSTSKSCPKLLIIDGLDECNGGETQQAIIHYLAAAITQYPLPLRVLILSRPEQPIQESFSHSERYGGHTSLHLGKNYQPDKDIKLFLKESFDAIRKTHILKSYIPTTWPSKEDISALVLKSSGQFIFASISIQYVKSSRHQPMDRLQHILGIETCGDNTPFAELDALYTHVLESADQVQRSTILHIFDFLLCTLPTWDLCFNEPSNIEQFLNLKPGQLFLALMDCQSIVSISPREDRQLSTVHFLHASMSDFLLDPHRSKNFFVDRGRAHSELARACMRGISSSRKSEIYARFSY